MQLKLTDIATNVHLNTEQIKSIHKYNKEGYTNRNTNTHNGKEVELYISILYATFQAYGFDDANKKFRLTFGALPSELKMATKPVIDKKQQFGTQSLKRLLFFLFLRQNACNCCPVLLL